MPPLDPTIATTPVATAASSDRFGKVADRLAPYWSDDCELPPATSAPGGVAVLLGFRHYDPTIGRFSARDSYEVPVGDTDNSNLYNYAAGDPVNRNDPSGMFALGIMSAFAGNLSVAMLRLGAPTMKSIGLRYGVDVEKELAFTNPLSTAFTSLQTWMDDTPPGAATGWEAMIPVWGSLKNSMAYYADGRWGWGTYYAALAVTDVLLVRSVITAAGKLVFKVGVASKGGVPSLTSLGGEVGKTVQQSQGVRVTSVPGYFIKEVDESASFLSQWYGRSSMDAQARGLQSLGGMAPDFMYDGTRLVTQDVGGFAGGIGGWARVRATGSYRLGTPFNDIWMRNIGASGQVFDPSLHPGAEMIQAFMLYLMSRTPEAF